MTKNIKISKDMILEAAFKIVKTEGIEKLSNREIANKLNCSIRPIYYQFQNTKDMKKALYQKIEKYFYKFLMRDINDSFPKYKQIGLNYIKFAKKEKKLFQALFMSNENLTPSVFVSKDSEDYKEVAKLIKISTNLSDNDIKEFHTRMWIFCHGIATLVANNTINIDNKQIEELLSMQFQALMLLEENKDNQWVLPNLEER